MWNNEERFYSYHYLSGRPWRVFPDDAANSHAWRHGNAFKWARNTFIPYWRGISSRSRARFLKKTPPPDDVWRRLLMEWADYQPSSPFDFSLSPEPPWICSEGEPVWSSRWKGGAGETWRVTVFQPFWDDLTDEQRKQYLIQWPPPDDEISGWEEEVARWLAEPRPVPLPDIDFSAALEPPWERYPDKLPGWYFWFGEPRHWLYKVFLPFWLGLPTHQKIQYYQQREPPESDLEGKWHDFLYKAMMNAKS